MRALQVHATFSFETKNTYYNIFSSIHSCFNKTSLNELPINMQCPTQECLITMQQAYNLTAGPIRSCRLSRISRALIYKCISRAHISTDAYDMISAIDLSDNHFISGLLTWLLPQQLSLTTRKSFIAMQSHSKIC